MNKGTRIILQIIVWFIFHPKKVSIYYIFCCCDWDLTLVSEQVIMASNKERIEALEAGLDGVQDGMHQLELGVTDKLHHLEETINKLSEAFLSTREASSNNNHGREGSFRSHREENDGGRQIFSSKMARLKFPKYSGEDPTEWLSRVAQFFEFQGIADNQKVTLASFHLEGEANQ